jgi:hypothetical protein
MFSPSDVQGVRDQHDNDTIRRAYRTMWSHNRASTWKVGALIIHEPGAVKDSTRPPAGAHWINHQSQLGRLCPLYWLQNPSLRGPL